VILEPGPKRYALPVSLAAHLGLLLLIAFYRPSPIFVTTKLLAMGNGDKSYQLVYFAPAGKTNQPEPEVKNALLAKAAKAKAAKRQKLKQEQANIGKQLDANNRNARAGVEYGSLFSGDYDGHDVRPAYPVVFPDPPVSRNDIPEGQSGDVIVEVSIDKLGNIIDMRLLQGMSPGIDQKVLATLRNWRYKPATLDGEPIAEKHDVHFHYPG
jgi:TonB family protein